MVKYREYLVSILDTFSPGMSFILNVVLVKKMFVLINFLLQNTNRVQVLGKIFPRKFCWSCLTGLMNFVNSV
jgi:hypothetical protein